MIEDRPLTRTITLGGLTAIASIVLISCAGTGSPDSRVPRKKRQLTIHFKVHWETGAIVDVEPSRKRS